VCHSQPVDAPHGPPDLLAPEALTAAQPGRLRPRDLRAPEGRRRTAVEPGARFDVGRRSEVQRQAILRDVKGDQDAPSAPAPIPATARTMPGSSVAYWTTLPMIALFVTYRGMP
jgi:hypothetical protein